MNISARSLKNKRNIITNHLHLGLYPEYFMGDTDGSWEEPAAPELSATIYSEEGISFLADAESIEETYGAKIISYEYDKPIENSFG